MRNKDYLRSIARHLCILASLLPAIAHSAPSVKDCEFLLAPDIETSKSDRHAAYAYVFINAEKEWEKYIANNRDKSKITAIVPEYFWGELDSATSAENFREKVTDKLRTEKVNFTEQTAKSTYRKYTSDTKVSAAKDCALMIAGGADYLILWPSDITQKDFILHIDWAPRMRNKNVWTLKIKIYGGSYEGKKTKDMKADGAINGRSMLIARNSPNETVSVTADIKTENIIGDAISVTKPTEIALATKIKYTRLCQVTLPNGTKSETIVDESELSTQTCHLKAQAVSGTFTLGCIVNGVSWYGGLNIGNYWPGACTP